MRGGGTEVNFRLYRRPPTEVLDRWRHDWNIHDFDPMNCSPSAGEVEKELSVQTVPGSASVPSLLLARGAQRLGWRNDDPAMHYPHAGSQDGAVRQSMTHVPSPSPGRAGARLRTGVRIDRLELANGRVTAATGTAATEAGPVTGADPLPGRVRVR
ncbi:MAG: GMC family oxidoreductase N-terminal domain-containing protein [Ilumatobacteraceae bacterium]